MKQKPTGWARRYLATLRAHLKSGAPTGLPWAQRLGHQAVVQGLKTLELARIHEQAMVTLDVTKNKRALRKRAETFFAITNATMAATQRAARQIQVHLSRLEKRTEQLARSNRQLQADLRQQELSKVAWLASGKLHDKRLAESLHLQKLFRQLMHQALTAQENNRSKISHELQNDIAQTLLGINLRLLALKQQEGHNAECLKNEIASAQRLVLTSAQSVRRFARELDSDPAGK